MSRGFYTNCLVCKEEFSNKNVYSREGWRETQISGFCEKYFDENTKEVEDFEELEELEVEDDKRN